MKKYIPMGLLLALFASAGHLAARTILPGWVGTWTAGRGKDRIVLKLREIGTFRWNNREGKYAVSRGQIWLVDKNRTGTKWRLTVTTDTLTLFRPEDFKYMGGRRYLYFQMTSPVLRYTFKRTVK